MKINHQIFYQGSVSLRTVRFGPFDFSEDDLQSLVRLSKEVLRSNLLKSKKYWSAGHRVTRYLGRCLASCSGITHAWFLMKRGDNLTDWIWDLILSRKIFNIRTSLICSKSVLLRKLIFDFKLALYATLNSYMYEPYRYGTSFFLIQINILNKISANLTKAYVDELRQSLSVLSCSFHRPFSQLETLIKL